MLGVFGSDAGSRGDRQVALRLRSQPPTVRRVDDKWEYTLVDTVISAYRDADNQLGEWLANLNALGDEGWELVSDTIIYGRGSNGMQWPVLLFKRRKRDG